PKDVQALGKTAQEFDYDFRILKSIMLVNEKQKVKLIPRVKEYFGGDLKGKTIALWGLAFKPYTDDIREAPSLYNIKALKRAGAKVVVFDPEAINNVKKEVGKKVKYAAGMY